MDINRFESYNYDVFEVSTRGVLHLLHNEIKWAEQSVSVWHLWHLNRL